MATCPEIWSLDVHLPHLLVELLLHLHLLQTPIGGTFTAPTGEDREPILGAYPFAPIAGS